MNIFLDVSEITEFYRKGLWTEKMVHDAVDHKYITEEQYHEIIGE